MRGADQIGRTVEEWHEYQREERRRHLRALVAVLRRAREDGDEWYRWVLEVRRRRLEGLHPIPSPDLELEKLL